MQKLNPDVIICTVPYCMTMPDYPFAAPWNLLAVYHIVREFKKSKWFSKDRTFSVNFIWYKKISDILLDLYSMFFVGFRTSSLRPFLVDQLHNFTWFLVFKYRILCRWWWWWCPQQKTCSFEKITETQKVHFYEFVPKAKS